MKRRCVCGQPREAHADVPVAETGCSMFEDEKQANRSTYDRFGDSYKGVYGKRYRL